MVLSENRDIKCDFSYFHSQDLKSNPNISFWKWQLDQYGFSMDSFPYAPKLISNRIRQMTQIVPNQKIFNEIKNRDFSGTFPITEKFSELKKALNLKSDEDYACIHIRQGDYLKAASRVIDLNETLNAISPMIDLLPQRMFIISDSPFSEKEIISVQFVLKMKTPEFIIGGDDNAVHGLMRTASFLVTSNSTFSYSAMLLASGHQISVTPNNFHGSKHQKINSAFILDKSWSFNNRNMTNEMIYD
jgi:hypothetical protein